MRSGMVLGIFLGYFSVLFYTRLSVEPVDASERKHTQIQTERQKQG